MFDPNGPLDQSICDAIMLAAIRKRNENQAEEAVKISILAGELGHDHSVIQNNAEYLILKGYLETALGGKLGLTSPGIEAASHLLDDYEE